MSVICSIVIEILYFYCIFSSVDDNLYYKIINFDA